jgi:hypothetical protein
VPKGSTLVPAVEELDDQDLRPDGLTVRDVPDRIAERGDLFRGALTAR